MRSNGKSEGASQVRTCDSGGEWGWRQTRMTTAPRHCEKKKPTKPIKMTAGLVDGQIKLAPIRAHAAETDPERVAMISSSKGEIG